MADKNDFIVKGRSRPLNQGPIIGTTQHSINNNGSGDVTLVIAIAGRKIKVHKLFLVGSAASNIRFYSGASAGANDLSGQMNMPSAFTLAVDADDFVLRTDAGEGLILNSSAVIQLGGWVCYSVE